MSFFRLSIRGTFPSYLLHFGTDICNLLHFGAKNSHLCFFLIGFFRVFIDFSLVSSLFPWCSLFFSVVFNWFPKGFHRFYPGIPFFFHCFNRNRFLKGPSRVFIFSSCSQALSMGFHRFFNVFYRFFCGCYHFSDCFHPKFLACF